MVAPIIAAANATSAATGIGTVLGKLGGIGGIFKGVTGAASALGGLFGKKGKRGPSWEDQLAMQGQEFNQRMKIAKIHNIHPLTMLGANLPTPSAPVYQSTSDNMGQNIARAAEGASALFTGNSNKIIEALQLERARLENDLLRGQITSINTQTASLAGQVGQSNDLAPQYSYKGTQIPVAMDEMGEVSQAYFDVVHIVPKLIQADAKEWLKKQAKENRSLFVKKDGKLRATPQLLKKLKDWALANQKG